MKDVNYLKENGVDVDYALSLLGDMETYNSIMSDYIDAYNERLNKIKDYKEKSDMNNYSIEVHSLKSDSKYLGLNTLAEISLKHEMASKEGKVEEVNNSFDELLKEADRAINICRTYLGKSSEESIKVEKKEEIDLTNTIKPVILVADDSPIIRNFVTDIFKDNYEVKDASTGREVADIISKNLDKIAILLLDLNMPDIDGFQVLEWFNQNNLFEKIPVSIITGANDKSSIDRAFKYPIVDMINKPFEREDIKNIVTKTLNQRNII